MLLINDILVSEDLFETHFACNLDACKGACCWEGDWGAPLEKEEVKLLEQARENLRPYLTDAGNDAIDSLGVATFYKEPGKVGTTLVDNRACAFLNYDDLGRGQCGIERACDEGVIQFNKPISCHLYPLRYEEDELIGFKALNYDRWDICTPACQKGAKLQIPLYSFVRAALIRKFGSQFYEALEDVATDLNAQKLK